MKMKLLLGSIGAVAILILVSFTSVVNVQSSTSGSINQSPLFSIRTNRATNNENYQYITSNYLGQGLNLIQFPLHDNRTALIHKVIEIIEKMDEKAISTFIAMNIGNQRKDISNQEIFNAIKQLKRNRNILTNYLDDIKNINEPNPSTFAGPGCQWKPGGLIIEIVLFIFLFLYFNIFVHYTLSHCYTSQCSP